MASVQSKSEYLKQWREARKARPAVVTITEKLCTKCGLVKPASEFYKMPEVKSGLRSDCKTCVTASQKAHASQHGSWASRNKEKVNARERVRHAQNPERRNAITRRWQEGNRHYFAEWAKSNPDKVREAQNRFRKTDKAKAIRLRRRQSPQGQAYEREYQRTHKQERAIREQKRRALKKGSGGSFSLIEWRELCERFGNKCLACCQSQKLTVDHVIPISKGGSNFIENIQPLCMKCNLEKGTQSTDYRVKELKAA